MTHFFPSVSPSVCLSVRPAVRGISHVTQKLLEISSPKFAGTFFGKIYNDFLNNLWPPRPILTSEVKEFFKNHSKFCQRICLQIFVKISQIVFELHVKFSVRTDGRTDGLTDGRTERSES